MELVLEGVEGCPEGSLLSVKVGETRRQAPVSKLGQVFKFATSPSEPLPLQVEVLQTVAKQTVLTDPTVDSIGVIFGKGFLVRLKQREVADLGRQPTDVVRAAEARGLPAEKVEAAQNGAKYLEEHGLVQLLQDLLHGLLLTRPSDPLSYMEEKVARAKALITAKTKDEATATKPAPAPSVPGATAGAAPAESARPMKPGPMPVDASDAVPRRQSLRGSIRTSVASQGKVEALLMSLHKTHNNLQVVLPLLPEEMRQLLVSDTLRKEAEEHFNALDSTKVGSLSAFDLIPMVVTLCNAHGRTIGTDYCRKLVKLFDADGNGTICMKEFTTLVQYVIITAYLESPEGRNTLEAAQAEEHAYSDFIRMIEDDLELLWTLIPFLPSYIVQEILSEEFMISCAEQFAALDADKSGSLEPTELIPVVQSLCADLKITINAERCKKFIDLFDAEKTGVILENQFVEFVQFVSVMNYLTGTEEGQLVMERADILMQNEGLTSRIADLERDPELLPTVLKHVPLLLKHELTNEDFSRECCEQFVAADAFKTGSLHYEALLPLIVKVSKDKFAFGCSIDGCRTACKAFCAGRSAFLNESDFPLLVRYCLVMDYLLFAKENEERIVLDTIVAREKVNSVLMMLQDNVQKIQEVVPFLPEGFKTELLSPDFEKNCETEFLALDVDSSGVLEPMELLPVVLSLCESHHLALTLEHARHFVSIFDVEGNGVITKREFTNLCRFLLILGFLETKEDALVDTMLVDTKAKNSAAIDSLLVRLQRDRHLLRKVLTVLPKELYEHLTSEEYVKACHAKFVSLDKDKTGVLRPHELAPLVVELAEGTVHSVTDEQCRRFTAIFDVHADGFLRASEFLDFARFVTVMSYLHTDSGKATCGQALEIMEGTKRIEDMLEMLRQDRRQVQNVMQYLPTWLRDELVSYGFLDQCMKSFAELDADGNGTLEPKELFSLILSLAEAHHMALDEEQCKRFTAIFDDAGDGVIRKEEYVNFCRFMMIMGYLHNFEETSTEAPGQSAPQPAPRQEKETSIVAPGQSAPQPAPRQDKVEAVVYEEKIEALSRENSELHSRLRKLEDFCAGIENRMLEREKEASKKSAEPQVEASKKSAEPQVAEADKYSVAQAAKLSKEAEDAAAEAQRLSKEAAEAERLSKEAAERRAKALAGLTIR